MVIVIPDTTRRDSTSSDKKLIASQYFQPYSINFKDVITYLFIFLISLFIYLFMYVLLIKAYILDKYLHFIVIPVTKHNIVINWVKNKIFRQF